MADDPDEAFDDPLAGPPDEGLSEEGTALGETVEDPAAADDEVVDLSGEVADDEETDAPEEESTEDPEATLELADAGRVSSGRSFLGFLIGLGMLVAVAGTMVLRLVEGVRWRIQRRRDEG